MLVLVVGFGSVLGWWRFVLSCVFISGWCCCRCVGLVW